MRFITPRDEARKVHDAFYALPSVGDTFHNFSDPYLNCNEQLNFVFSKDSKLNPKGKSILTACCSGDQILRAFAAGAAHVDSFDITYFAKIIFNIKTAAIKTLNFDDYNNLLATAKSGNYSDKHLMYEKIKPAMTQTDSVIFDTLEPYMHFCCDGIKYEISLDEFNKLKSLDIQPGEFFWSPIDKLANDLDGKKYDIIYTSNIFDRCYTLNDPGKEKPIISALTEHLNPGGILAGYSFWENQYNKENYTIYPCPKFNNLIIYSLDHNSGR